MKVCIRKFEKRDISNKVRWINDPLNNMYLHYDLPLEVMKTEEWFEKNKDRTDRYDAVIEADGNPIGLIGLLSIDTKNKKAEYYITLGERNYLGKGIAMQASRLLLEYAFLQMGLNRVYLYTETENIAAVKAYKRIGFKREGVIRQDIYSKGRYVDRYVYGITKEDFLGIQSTPILKIDNLYGNHLYIKREDFIPISFGGNKARKAQLFFEEIDRGNYDSVVTYGSSSSNHCRVITNMAAARNMKIYIISPKEASEDTFNRKMMEMFGAKIDVVPIERVHDTIEETIKELKNQGLHPYFIAGGGHGNIGTQAYVDCYEEIRKYEKEQNLHFDYIFFASGTGTTQAGLVCGQIINRDDRKIIGISIARKKPRGWQIVLDSIHEYLDAHEIFISDDEIEAFTIFDDNYIGGGYAKDDAEIEETIKEVLKNYGIPLDPVYTGKAYKGMMHYITEHDVVGKNILFIHTGGLPLFFDALRGI